MSSLPEYVDELTKEQQKAAEMVGEFRTVLQNIVEEIALGEIKKKIEDMYIDEIIDEVVTRLNTLLQPVVMEGVRKEVKRVVRSTT